MTNYNLTGIDSASNYYDVFHAVSQWHGGLFPLVFVACSYFIMLMLLKDFVFVESNVVASFVTMFLAIIFGALGLLSWTIIIIPIMFFIISMFILIFFRP